MKSPEWLVNENLIPMNKAYCTFILNVSPNRDGLVDDNAVEALKEIGRLYKGKEGPEMALGKYERPITAENIAKHRPAESSWSNDGSIMDYGNDDNFGSAWLSNKRVKEPWFEVELEQTGERAVVRSGAGTHPPLQHGHIGGPKPKFQQLPPLL